MKIYQFVIATAAVAWPMTVTAQDAAGLGDGTRLGAAAEKGTVSAPEKAPVETSLPAMAGTDPKLGEPGIIALPEPEIAEAPAASGSVKAAVGGALVAEPAAAAKVLDTAVAPIAGASDTTVETTALAPDPEAKSLPPLPEAEIGADPVQPPVAAGVDADLVVASAELGGGVASDKDAPGEEFVRLSREDTAELPRPASPELLEALAATVLTLPAGIERVDGGFGADPLAVAPLPGEFEEPREIDLAAFARMSGASTAILEAASTTRLTQPNLAFADTTEEVMSGEETAVLAALADDPTADFEEKSMTDPNEIVCLEALGAPNAGVPVSKAAAAATRARLAEAAPACDAAAAGQRPSPEVLYFAAEIALARRDFPGAFALYEKAAAGGVGAADTKLADFYVYGAPPVQRDNAKAAELYVSGAELGDPQAMTALAMMHREGTGVPQNPARMVELLTEAANAGYHFAQYRLAQTYLNGDGIPGRADPALGIPDPTRAVSWFTRAADAGNIEAALELAGLYSDPDSGLPDNPAEQARLTRLAADTGLASAIAALGVLYETGRGVVRSPETAAEQYVQALETGEVAFADLRRGAPFEWDYDTATAFQNALTQRGVYNGIVDGIVGPGTRAAAEALAGG